MPRTNYRASQQGSCLNSLKGDFSYCLIVYNCNNLQILNKFGVFLK